jgi:DNA-binding transcriptional LysR family regulator
MRIEFYLQNLIALEAVSRHASMSGAAKEICVTQSAISHRIKKLELETGVPLLKRQNRKIELTEYGQQVVDFVRPILDRFDGYSQLIKSFGRNKRLQIGIGSALYSCWLGSRLEKFRKVSDNVAIEFVTLWSLEQFETVQPDISILPVSASKPLDPMLDSILFHDEVFPVCRPQLDVNDANTKLIEKSPLSAKDNKLSWTTWLDQVGHNYGLRSRDVLRFDSTALVMAAVQHGSGIGLGSTLLNIDSLCDGTLVRPLPNHAKTVSHFVHVIRRSSKFGQSKELDVFVNWLSCEAEESYSAFAELNR